MGNSDTQISPKKVNLRKMKKRMRETAHPTFDTCAQTFNQNLAKTAPSNQANNL